MGCTRTAVTTNKELGRKFFLLLRQLRTKNKCNNFEETFAYKKLYLIVLSLLTQRNVRKYKKKMFFSLIMYPCL